MCCTCIDLRVDWLVNNNDTTFTRHSHDMYMCVHVLCVFDIELSSIVLNYVQCYPTRPATEWCMYMDYDGWRAGIMVVLGNQGRARGGKQYYHLTCVVNRIITNPAIPIAIILKSTNRLGLWSSRHFSLIYSLSQMMMMMMMFIIFVCLWQRI